MFSTLLPSQEQLNALLWLISLHVLADWLLQTDWMAMNKRNLRHPASWVRSGIHFVLAGLFYAWPLAHFVAVTHLLIDTRIPTHWWMEKVKGMDPASPFFGKLEIPMDQALHYVTLIIAVYLFL